MIIFKENFCESKCDNLLRGATTKNRVRIGTVGDKLNHYGLQNPKLHTYHFSLEPKIGKC